MNGISVIVCCFNSADRIIKTIENLALQKTNPELSWEIIFVNNASTDNTEEVIKSEWSKYQVQNVGFTVVNETSPGLIFARSKGVDIAKYSCILFCDDDNWLGVDYVARAYATLVGNAQIGAVSGRSTAVTDASAFPDWFKKNEVSYAVGQQAEQSGDISAQGFVLWGAGMATRKKLFIEAFSNHKSLLPGRTGTALTSGEDSEYCLRLLFMNYRLYYDDFLEFKHFIPQARLTEDYLNRLSVGFIASYEILRKYYLVLQLHNITSFSKGITLIKSVCRLSISTILNEKKWNKTHEALVIYFLTNVTNKYVTEDAIVIKKLFNEFKKIRAF